MFSHNGKISARQVMLTLMMILLNMEVLMLPTPCSIYAGRNGYLLPILSSVLGIIYVGCIALLYRQFEQETLSEIADRLLPRPIAILLVGLLVIKLLVGASIQLRLFGEMVTSIMLSQTPIEVVMLTLLLAGAYLAKSGIEALGRMAEILAYFIFIPLIIVLLFVSFHIPYEEVLPLVQTDQQMFLTGIGRISLGFVPVEVLLIIGGMMKKPKKLLKAGSLAVILMGLLQSVLVLFSLCTLGVSEVRSQIWPTITFMATMGTQTSVLQKQEVLMMIIWIFSIFMYVSTMICTTSILVSRQFRYRRQNIFVLPFIVIIYALSTWMESSAEVYNLYLKFRVYTGIWFLVPIPLILFIICKLRGKADEK